MVEPGGNTLLTVFVFPWTQIRAVFLTFCVVEVVVGRLDVDVINWLFCWGCDRGGGLWMRVLVELGGLSGVWFWLMD